MKNHKANINNIIDELISETINANLTDEMHLHERYLHHRFSFLAQEAGYYISFNNKTAQFHPEWATAIKGIRDGGFYKGIKEGYVPCDVKKDKMNDALGGNPGFIDFAIGGFYEPDYAIEFKMAKGMNTKGFEFDYMKLLDKRNHFKNAISLSVLYSRKTPLDSEVLGACFDSAKNKLGHYYDKEKPYRFIVIQLLKGNYYIWERNNDVKEFKLISQN